MAAVAAADGGMQTIKLTWEKITLGIDIGPKDNRTKKYILNNINGEALPGEMLAIMGPSGSGKTSLLNALARRNDAFEGSLKMNGLDMMGRGLLFNSRTAYMHQDEKFLAELTCREHLQFQAKLRTSLPASERAVKVNSLLLELGLDKIANSLIGDEHGEAGNHISRNERKRLSFASELLTNPTLLFVDEPTTGLDSFMAESVVKTLQGLATGPRQCTIVATIHQPAAETYRLFDKVCFLVGGQVGYFGTLPGVVDFVNELKYPLPMHCCPADHVLRLFVNPDDPEGSQRRRTEIVQAFAAKNPQGNISAVQDLTEAQAKERAEEMAKADRDAATSRNFLVQVITLCVREAIMRARSVKVFRTRLIQHIVFGVWFGLTYLRVEINQGSITTVTAALFFCMMITLFMGPMGVAQTLPEQLKVYLRETRAGSYMITSMYAAKTLLDIPFEAFFTFIWAAITYFMIGFRGDRVGANFGDEVLDFFPFWGCLFLLSYLAFAFGYFAAFTAPISAPEIGFLLTLFMMIPQMIFGGFFINLDVVPKWLHWIRDIALLRHGFTIMNIIQWDNYGSVPCDGDYCPFGADATGKDIRENYVGTDEMWVSLVVMVAISIVFRLLALWRLLKKAKPSVFDSAAPDAGTMTLAEQDEKDEASEKSIQKRQQILLEWKQVSFVPQGRAVLDSITGSAKPGRLLVVMGPSGCGKTCLLNAITSRNVNISGTVSYNGKPWQESLASQVAYMHQEDMFLPDLTVREHLSFTAQLKMHSSITAAERNARIDSVITKLGLTNCQNTCIGMIGAGISGGERKRCSLAAEILSDPAILIVDEPTSGLDSAMAESVVRLLDDLAKGTDGSGPRTVVATIHQPSRDIFLNFSDLLILADGKVAYHGDAQKAVDYFEKLDHPCPMDTNPPEHFMRLVSHHLGADEEKRAESRNRLANITDRHAEHAKGRSNSEDDVHRESSLGHGYYTPVVKQFWILYRRETLLRRRSRVMFKAVIARTVIMSILVGLVWFQLDDEGTLGMIQSFLGALQFCMSQLFMTSGAGLVQTLPALLPAVLRDNHNGLYSVTAWYFSKILADLPFEVIFPFIFISCSFWMVGFGNVQEDSGDVLEMYGWFCLLGVLTAQAGHAFGLLCAALGKDQNVAFGIFSAFIFPWMFYAGLMINYDDIPAYFEWLHWTSAFKYVFTSFAVSVFDGATLVCPEGVSCPYPSGAVVLEQFAMKPSHRTRSVIALVVHIVVCRILSWLFLVLAAKRINIFAVCKAALFRNRRAITPSKVTT